MNRMKVNTVSIITPCLNSESTIRKTIESVLRQSYHNIEYIIIDGNSTDKTVNIIEEYAPLFEKRLQYISEKDDGIYDAMNKGIRLAKGDVIGIINSDDWYEVDAIEQVMKCFSDIQTDIVYGNIWKINEKGEKESCEERKLDTMWYQMAIPHPATFVKKAVYQKYGLFNIKYKIAADYELMLRFYSVGLSFHHIDTELTNFRIGGVSQKSRILMWNEGYEIAFNYIYRCAYKESVLPILKENYAFFCLEKLLEENSEKLQEILENFWNCTLKQIYIFGAGDWGRKCCNALKDIVKGFLDNKKEKIDLIEGKPIVDLQEIDCINSYILIAVRNYDNEIRKQLETEHFIHITSIRQIAESYCRENNNCKY